MNPSSLPGLAGLAGEPIARRSLDAGAMRAGGHRYPGEAAARGAEPRGAGAKFAPADPAGQDPGDSGAADHPVRARTGRDGSRDRRAAAGGTADRQDGVRLLWARGVSQRGARVARPSTTVLLCGMESHICVMQTALGALENGYMVHVASDAVSSRTELNWRLGLERMESAGCVISSTEMMMYELLRRSGTAQFKEMLPFIK